MKQIPTGRANMSLLEVANAMLDDLDGGSKVAFVPVMQGVDPMMAAQGGAPAMDPGAGGMPQGPADGGAGGIPMQVPVDPGVGEPPTGMPGPQDLQQVLIEALRSVLPQVLQEMGYQPGGGEQPKKKGKAEQMEQLFARVEQIAQLLNLPPPQTGQQAGAPAATPAVAPGTAAPGGEAPPPMPVGPLDPGAAPYMAGVKLGSASGIHDADDGGKAVSKLLQRLRGPR